MRARCDQPTDCAEKVLAETYDAVFVKFAEVHSVAKEHGYDLTQEAFLRHWRQVR